MSDHKEDISSSGTTTTTAEWQPNERLLSALIEMGINGEVARQALFCTGNESADLAAAWILESGDGLQGGICAAQRTQETGYDMYKMVFVVNMELQMGAGKIAAQVAHATLGLHRIMLQDETKYGEMLLDWEAFGETKIVLRGDNTSHLVDLEKKSLSMGMPTYLVHDAGKTQIPEGSTTVLSIMGRVDLVDEVTGKLKLL